MLSRTLLASLLLASCHRQSTTYESRVMLHGVQPVHRDASGKPVALEVTVEYPDCPGDQLETLQGNAAFTSCMAKYKVGDTLPASIVHQPMPDGHWDSEITRIGDCERPRDRRDARSYEDVQVCNDVIVNGLVVGFHCDRKPTKELLEKCPWFARK